MVFCGVASALGGALLAVLVCLAFMAGLKDKYENILHDRKVEYMAAMKKLQEEKDYNHRMQQLQKTADPIRDYLEISLDEGAFPPTRGHDTDAGLDFKSREDAVVKEGGSHVFHTGVHVRLPGKTGGLMVSKSGLNVFHDIISTGLIDEGYSGEVVVKLYNLGTEPYQVKAGDKISQMCIIPVKCLRPKIVDVVVGKDRGDKGFGSTGR